MAKSEYLMLANPYDASKHLINGWWMSEKMDGHRALWIPSTRGVTDCLIATEKGVATGLWSRYGKIVYAPTDWLDQLPKDRCLDGELWNPTMSREAISSIITRSVNLIDWSPIKYYVFDSPDQDVLTATRTIYKLGKVGYGLPIIDRTSLSTRYLRIPESRGVMVKVEQTQLPLATPLVNAAVDAAMKQIVAKGGEGVVVRDPWSGYKTERVWSMLKIKPRDSSEAEIVGFTLGKGRLSGKVGALIVRDHGVEFELSGMTDAERVHGVLKVGDRVRYDYRKLSDKGVPIEAAYKGKC